ncbi:MAG: L,D-transpeptidase [Anaerolineae bacterium]|jgi:hypothetical protein|nr:L,D-transpeptidase [Anaerolineae bacterium]
MVTRRAVLKGLAAAAAAVLTPRLAALAESAAIPISPEPEVPSDSVLTGRAIHTVTIYREPSASSERVTAYTRDQSFAILGEVRAPFSAHNDLWYETDEGYAHSAWVLPVRVYPAQPFLPLENDFGFWGEISVVHTEGRTAPSANAGSKYRFYGGLVFHVIDAVTDESGVGWYKVVDDYPPRQSTNHQWVLAQDVRRIPRAEMAPIHPFAGGKRIEVDLTAQKLVCYEGSEIVFETLVASGMGGILATPTGQHSVILKQASRHMSNVPYADMKPEDRPAPGDIFDLPGVPWNTFIDLAGTAIHGAYWHNDFGVRRSHGCVNVSHDAARFVYRWTYPIGGYDDDFVQGDARVGTPVIVF